MLIDPSQNIPSTQSSSNDWITWYKSLDYYMTRQEANYLFLKAWKARGNSDANDDKLRSFLDSKGLKLDADWSDFDFLKNPLGITDWFKNSANKVFIAIAILLGLVFIIAYQLSKNVKLNVPLV